MDTHTRPTTLQEIYAQPDPWADGELAARLRRAQDRIVQRPEWVRRAQSATLVRKDMTGMVAS